MKWTLIVIEAALLGAILSLTSCGEVGRYQMVISPPFEGGQHYWEAETYVLDTKTGVVFRRAVGDRDMSTWDPVNKAFNTDSLAVTFNK